MVPIQPEEHLAWLLGQVTLLPASDLPTPAALHRTLAAPVTGAHPLPLWDNSAMDGYALRSADIAQATREAPVTLRLVGEVGAGSGADPVLDPGTAVRIMTGAPVPSSCDAVIAVEHTSGEAGPGRWAEEIVRIVEPVAPGRHIRRAGEDAPAGSRLGEAGEHLSAARISALVAAGIDRVTVRHQPRVAVIATGAELRPPGAELGRGQIPESNSTLVRALLAESGITAVSAEHCPDDVDQLAGLIARRAEHADVIITTGGIGPGVFDVTRIVLDAEPGVRSVRVAMRPGAPQAAGLLADGTLIIALPGNPVAAAVGFEIFARPALLATQGRSSVHRLRLPATAATDWRGAPDRLQVLPVQIADGEGGLRVWPAVDPRGVSHAVGGHGRTHGYALVEPERGDVARGEQVTVILLGS